MKQTDKTDKTDKKRMKKMARRGGTNGVGAAAIGIVLAATFGVNAAYQYGTKEDVTFTVEKLTEKRHGETEKYLVGANHTNGQDEVFENTDAWLSGKFNSSDVQLSELEVGKTYNAAVYGWRVPFLSWYRNIVEVEEVAGQQNAPQTPKAKNQPGA